MPKESDQHHASLRFFNLTASDREALQRFKPIVDHNIGSIIETFYAHLTSYPDLSAKFTAEDNLTHARQIQADHWHEMFNGLFDKAFFQGSHCIAMMHERVGLEPHRYMAGYAFALGDLLRLAVESCGSDKTRTQELCAAISKATMLDIDSTISGYTEACRVAASKRLESLVNAFEMDVLPMIDRIGVAAVSMQQSAVVLAAYAERSFSSAAASAPAVEPLVVIRTMSAFSEPANHSISNLAEAGEKIGHVVKLIQSIAGHAHLLALNATVEASRAGEAGKGFEVVANDVRCLATETAQATKEISEQVNAIQQATSTSALNLGRLSKAMNQLNSNSCAMSAATKSQGVLNSDVTGRSDDAALQLKGIAANVANAAEVSVDDARPTKAVLMLAQELVQQTSQLRASLSVIIQNLRSATTSQNHSG